MMNDRELASYLGLSHREFDALRRAAGPARIEGYRLLAEVSANLEQLPTKYNRPPPADEASDAELEALSAAAFARLEASAAENEAFRQQRADGAQRARMRRLDKAVVAAYDGILEKVPAGIDMAKAERHLKASLDCTTTGLGLAAKVAKLGK